MKRSLGLGAIAISTLLVSGCAASASMNSDNAAASAPDAFFTGSYTCTTNMSSGGFTVDNLFGPSDVYFGGGKLDVRKDGTWEITPKETSALHTAGTWALDGATLSVAVTGSETPLELSTPGFPTTKEAAASGTTVLISHSNVREATALGFSMTAAGTVILTNDDREQMTCVKS